MARNSAARRIREDFGNPCVTPIADLVGVSDGSLIADRQLMTAAGATPGEHRASILGFHALTEPMRFRALAIIGLKCTFRHLRFLRSLYAHNAESGGAKVRIEVLV